MKNNYNIFIKSNGKSMLPLITDVSEIIVDTSKRNYSLGDICSFLENRGLVAHRIIQESKWQNKKTWLLKGDNNNLNDGYLLNKDLLGIVTHIFNQSEIIDLSKHKKLTNIITFASIHSQSKKIYSYFFKYLSISSAHLLKYLNKNTANNEILYIINSIKNNQNIFNSKDINNDLLHYLSLKNKHIKILSSTAQKKIEQSFFIEILNHEKDRVVSFLSKQKIIVTSLNNPKLETKIDGSDIDLLIPYNQLTKTINVLKKNNYIIKSTPPQEVTLINKTNNIEIDLHFLINLPRELFFNKKRSLFLTNEYLKTLSNKENTKFKNEYFLLKEILCFWTNDFLKGLHTLYKIGKFAKESNICAKKLEYVSRKHNFHRESQLVLQIYNNIFDDKVCTRFLKNTTFITKIIVAYYNFRKISVFSAITKWWDEGNFYTNTINRELYITSLLINNKTKFKRKIRVRIITFIFKALLAYFFNRKMFFPKKYPN